MERSVTAATGLKRLGIPVAAIVLACFAALAAVSLFMPFDTVRDAAKAEIRNVTGLDVVLRGDVDVSLFPTGSITFDNVTLGEDTNPVLAADQLIARLRFIPLLTGRIEISDIALIRPRIKVSYDRDGRSNWAATIETLARRSAPRPIARSTSPRSPRSGSTTAPSTSMTLSVASRKHSATSTWRWPGRRSPRALRRPAVSSGTASRWTLR